MNSVPKVTVPLYSNW